MPLYTNRFFTLFADRVVQGESEAVAYSPDQLSSNFRSLPDNPLTEDWTPTLDLSEQARYRSDQPLIDALFTLATEEALQNIEADGTLRTGAKWDGVWTRDVSYSLILSLALLHPEAGKTSLRQKVKKGRIVQDTGSGGAWPVSSDRTIWIVAAWEIYLVTGDTDWLREVYPIVRDTLEDDYRTLHDPVTGMYRGESSFLDWREQTYPAWMTNADIYASRCLGTNVAHYAGHRIALQMAEELGEPAGAFEERAKGIRRGTNLYLWNESRGYYGQFLYGRGEILRSERFEALGEALAILYGVASERQAEKIVEQAPLTPFGITCIDPQIPGIPAYHNNGIWPFVQAFWNLAAARVGNTAVLEHGLACLYRPAALFLSNYENMIAETGGYVGTEVNSSRMLWSIAGNLAMVYRVFLGISSEPGGIRFQPVVPRTYAGRKALSGFRYRDMILDIEVNGYGSRIDTFSLDGNVREQAFIQASLTGRHRVEVTLADEPLPRSAHQLAEVHFSLPAPQVHLRDASLNWLPVTGGVAYQLFRNGEEWVRTDGTSVDVDPAQYGSYVVTAIDKLGYASFGSEPVTVAGVERRIQLETIAPPSDFPTIGFRGAGCVRVATDENRILAIPVHIEHPGTYLIDIRYANGSGPVNTENKCGIRSMYVNDRYAGVWVFPQRGEGEWSDWGWSNRQKVALHTGKNEIRIVYEPWNRNMDGEINEALLDEMRLVRISES
jgi:hypothetical protein